MKNRKADYNLIDVPGPYQPIDFHTIGRFIVRNKTTGETVLSHGFTLATACFQLGWKEDEVMATGKYKHYKTAYIAPLGTWETLVPDHILPQYGPGNRKNEKENENG